MRFLAVQSIVQPMFGPYTRRPAANQDPDRSHEQIAQAFGEGLCAPDPRTGRLLGSEAPMFEGPGIGDLTASALLAAMGKCA